MTKADRWMMVVRGVAQLTVEDQQRRRIGPGRDSQHGMIENQIPGATYSPGRLFSSVFLNQPGVYTFTLTGEVPNNVHVSLNLFNAVSKLGAMFFQGVPMTQRSRAQLVYDTADQLTIPVLALDREGNGEIEHIRATILSPQESDCIAPPTTRIDVRDGIVTVSATATSGGAALLRTYYTTDGLTRSVYTEPFPLPPDAKIVMAYSEDQAGNLEYPGAVRPVLGLSETDVILKVGATTREPVLHTVDVMNRDPVSLAGELEWEALTDAPWLSIEPRAGTTPDSITMVVSSVDLAAHLDGISRDSYEANVVVRARTPGTVFAEQTLRVQVQKE